MVAPTLFSSIKLGELAGQPRRDQQHALVALAVSPVSLSKQK